MKGQLILASGATVENLSQQCSQMRRVQPPTHHHGHRPPVVVVSPVVAVGASVLPVITIPSATRTDSCNSLDQHNNNSSSNASHLPPTLPSPLPALFQVPSAASQAASTTTTTIIEPISPPPDLVDDDDLPLLLTNSRQQQQGTTDADPADVEVLRSVNDTIASLRLVEWSLRLRQEALRERMEELADEIMRRDDASTGMDLEVRGVGLHPVRDMDLGGFEEADDSYPYDEVDAQYMSHLRLQERGWQHAAGGSVRPITPQLESYDADFVFEGEGELVLDDDDGDDLDDEEYIARVGAEMMRMVGRHNRIGGNSEDLDEAGRGGVQFGFVDEAGVATITNNASIHMGDITSRPVITEPSNDASLNVREWRPDYFSNRFLNVEQEEVDAVRELIALERELDIPIVDVGFDDDDESDDDEWYHHYRLPTRGTDTDQFDEELVMRYPRSVEMSRSRHASRMRQQTTRRRNNQRSPEVEELQADEDANDSALQFAHLLLRRGVIDANGDQLPCDDGIVSMQQRMVEAFVASQQLGIGFNGHNRGPSPRFAVRSTSTSGGRAVAVIGR